ncbi:GtrA family protein [Vibrio sp. SS-MA-C1-2]|uniref:GtrA family protein n=1 Tax=Vibrio sp. SS-MA-C1-2 TaxID=2908646 RepID=UPI001F1AECFB|nr:GtrA family protein [Vibrio sp. SS-MA-C1-2]UJF18570.1 GtrA family protein [Vibrio sp. SS-MA-C1-2]
MMTKFFDLKAFWQLNRFAFIGGLSTLVHLSIVKLYFHFIPSVSEYTANIAAFSVAFFVSYFGHRYITFNKAGSFWRFLLVALLGFLVNNLILTGLLQAQLVSGWLSVTISTLCMPIIIFILAKVWVFKS